ncbi:MAG TPA: hypothetical protein DDX89_07250 [Candidatus Omnitrophica bacterium]|nr:hypothetical protein [Candidatus Omnitrophota bacterium]
MLIKGGVCMKNRGFTLVELIAVVIILGILLAVGIPQYRRAIERARGAAAYSTLASIQSAEEVYRQEFDIYHSTPANIGVTVPPAARSGWAFTIDNTVANAFTATATRAATGPCGGNLITIDQAGTVAGNWEGCVNGL